MIPVIAVPWKDAKPWDAQQGGEGGGHSIWEEDGRTRNLADRTTLAISICRGLWAICLVNPNR